MKAYGRVKFFDSKKKKFGFINIVKSDVGVSDEDAIFFENDWMGENAEIAQGTIVVFDLFRNKDKYRGKDVRPYLEAPSGKLFAFMRLFKEDLLQNIFEELIDRGAIFNEDKIKFYFESIEEITPSEEVILKLWSFVKHVDNEFGFDCFYEYIDRKVFQDTDYDPKVFSPFFPLRWFYLERIDVFFSEKALNSNNHSLASLFKLYHWKGDIQKTQTILDVILPKLTEFHDSRLIYYVLNYVESPDTILSQYLNNNEIATEFLTFIKDQAVSSTNIRHQSTINSILKIIKNNSWDIPFEVLSGVDYHVTIDQDLEEFFIVSLLSSASRVDHDSLINASIGLFSRYKNFQPYVIDYSLRKLGINGSKLLQRLNYIQLDQKSIKQIQKYNPSFYLDCPELFLNLILNNQVKSTEFDKFKILNKFKVITIETSDERNNSLRENIFLYYLNELIIAQADNLRLEILYNFFFSDPKILKLAHKYCGSNLSTESDSYKTEVRVVQKKFSEFVTNSQEVLLLLRMLGAIKPRGIKLDLETIKSIFRRVNLGCEYFLLQYFSAVVKINPEIRIYLLSIIRTTDFRAFESIVVKNLFSIENSNEKEAISQLNKSFLEGYIVFSKVGYLSLEEYFSLECLVKKCEGRKSTSYPVKFEFKGRSVMAVRESKYKTLPITTFCEGRFWKSENYLVIPGAQMKNVDLFWCRGAVCMEPTRKINFLSSFCEYTLHEIAAAFGYGFTDLVYSTMAGWLNRTKEILRKLHCNDCKSPLIPVSFVPNNLGYYATPLFMCPNQSCSKYQENIRFTHCINCATILDSRELDTCSNGWLECPNCDACCPQHSGKTYTPRYRQ